jgi:hypothetical protein
MQNVQTTGINNYMNDYEIEDEGLMPVEGHPDLGRDPLSHAIINTSNNQYKQAVEAYKRNRAEKERIAKMEEDMNNVKQDLSEIKSLLKSLIGNN